MTLGYFTTIENNHIRTLEDGGKVFFPHGFFGRGYIVPSPQLEQVLRHRIRIFYIIILIAVCGLVGGLVGGGALAGFTRVSLVTYMALFGLMVLAISWATYLYFRPQTRQMQLSSHRNSPMTLWKSGGRTLHPVLIIVFTLVILLLVIGSLSLYAVTHDNTMLVGGGLLGLVFLFPYCVMIWERFFGKQDYLKKSLVMAAILIAIPVGVMAGKGILGLVLGRLSPFSEQDLAAMCAKTNATLPRQIDEWTRLDSVAAGPGNRVTYCYTLVTLSSDQIDPVRLTAAMKPKLINLYRTSPDMEGSRRRQVELCCQYNDKKGLPIATIVISPKDF